MESTRPRPRTGAVYLIGAGPGDPELLTLKAFRLLQQADVVVHDRLVARQVLDLARPDAERIFAGKQGFGSSHRQEDINRLLIDKARAGLRVARLKGGDPFIFGRGGEELDALAEAGIPFQVVPGVTAATGCAAYAGIPLTHRDHAQSVRFITAHTRDGRLDLGPHRLDAPGETLVFYMGLTHLGALCRALCAEGQPRHRPAAVVAQGTTAGQRVMVGTLESLPGRVAAAALESPAILVVGEVVKLHSRFEWFEPARGAGPAFSRTPAGGAAPRPVDLEAHVA